MQIVWDVLLLKMLWIIIQLLDKVLHQIKAQLAILNVFSDFYFSLHETVFSNKSAICILLKCWSLKDGQSRKIKNNRRSRIQLSRSLCPEKILCNLFFVLFMKFTPQVSTPHIPVVCHIKCNCSNPEQPKIEADRSHFTLSLNISAVYYTPAVILLSLLSE